MRVLWSCDLVLEIVPSRGLENHRDVSKVCYPRYIRMMDKHT